MKRDSYCLLCDKQVKWGRKYCDDICSWIDKKVTRLNLRQAEKEELIVAARVLKEKVFEMWLVRYS